jgi:glycosyltransferase involved in cell wall biosynthesis
MIHKGAGSVSVFFPFYNEEANIRATVQGARETLERLDTDYEIILIDDGSSDRTGMIADEYASHDPRIRVVHHAANSGYGAAVRSGLAAATKECVFFMDGDGQFDIREMPAMLIVHLSF